MKKRGRWPPLLFDYVFREVQLVVSQDRFKQEVELLPVEVLQLKRGCKKGNNEKEDKRDGEETNSNKGHSKLPRFKG
jgi:hypothetical protein